MESVKIPESYLLWMKEFSLQGSMMWAGEIAQQFKSTGCSSRKPTFGSQHPPDGHQLFTVLVPDDPVLFCHPQALVHRHTRRQNTHTH